MNRAAAGSTRRPFAEWASSRATGSHRGVGDRAWPRLRCACHWRRSSTASMTLATSRRRSASARGGSLEGMFPLFRTRVGMAYPLGWLLQAGWLVPAQFWILTVAAECVTLGLALRRRLAVGRHGKRRTRCAVAVCDLSARGPAGGDVLSRPRSRLPRSRPPAPSWLAPSGSAPRAGGSGWDSPPAFRSVLATS